MAWLPPQFRWLIALALAQVPASAIAADTAPAGRWVVDWGDIRCTLARTGAPVTFILRTVPGSGIWEIRFDRRELSRLGAGDPRRLTFTLLPGGNVLPDRTYIDARTGIGGTLVIYQLSRSLVDEWLPSAQSLRIARNGRTLAEIALPEAAQAVAAMRRCEDEAMREWGMDPVAFDALRLPPAGNAAAVVNDNDYPAAAVRANQSGTVAVRLMVDSGGRITDCTPVVSSGSEVLDSRTCEIYRQRLRLHPAVGADGSPTGSPVVVILRWVLPGR